VCQLVDKVVYQVEFAIDSLDTLGLVNPLGNIQNIGMTRQGFSETFEER
jgi:hypothetical protein